MNFIKLLVASLLITAISNVAEAAGDPDFEPTGKYHAFAHFPQKKRADFKALISAERFDAFTQGKKSAVSKAKDILGEQLLGEINAIADEIPDAVEVKDDATLQTTLGALMAVIAKVQDLAKEVKRLKVQKADVDGLPLLDFDDN